ncbi:MAG: UbiA family prenyltransferase [Elusimicrobia bacterium]|nr:UbiA family prenyltransferase [Elusimicrobiota bacterium]
MKVLKVLIKNIRPFRSMHFSMLLISGALVASWHPLLPGLDLTYWIKVIALILSIIFAFQAACVVNDFYDLESDKLTNPSRPLVKNAVSPSVYKKWGIGCFILSLILSLIAGLVPFLLILLYHLVASVYSIPPFRLKSFFPLNTLLVALGGVIATVAGFSILAGTDTFQLIPIRFVLMVGAILVLSVNMIYIKDREGDRAEGIQSIPTMMSERTSRWVIALLTVVAYFCPPFILGIKQFYYFSALGALLGAYWVLRKKWSEVPYFITYFSLYVVLMYFIRENGVLN